MIAAIRDHQHKSHGIRDALRSQGWLVVPAPAPADVLLIDLDIDLPSYRNIIRAYRAAGSKIVLYPHGLGPAPYCWDADLEPYPVDTNLQIGTGHRDVLEAYGYPFSVHPIGWSYCEQRPFQGPKSVERVLFAPAHPLGGGYITAEDVAANQAAYKTLLSWGIPLTVRHVSLLELNGLWRVDGVEYEEASLDLNLGSLDEHDLVVAAPGTFLSLAVARGVPAVAYAQVKPPLDPFLSVQPKHWDAYADLIRYPYDLSDPTALTMACQQEAADWRRRFVGEQIDPKALSDLLTGVCERPDGRVWVQDTPLDIEDDPDGGVASVVAREIVGNYRLDEIEFMPGDVVLDLGAHVGMVSIYLAKRHPDIRIYAFEPVPENYRRLVRNLEANGITNVEPHNCAVTSDGRELTMTVNLEGNSGGPSAFAPEALKDYDKLTDGRSTIRVPSTTLADIFKNEYINLVRLLKIDVEGAEYEILGQANGLIERIDHVRGELHVNRALNESGADPDELIARLRDATDARMAMVRMGQ